MNKVLIEKEGLCLHIGCGLNIPDSWENIDASPSLILSKVPVLSSLLLILNRRPNWQKSVKYGDVIKGLNYQENSCDLIFAAHVLEHLSLSDFHLALDNIYSYLKPGGIFRFIVPDLKQYIDLYMNCYSEVV